MRLKPPVIKKNDNGPLAERRWRLYLIAATLAAFTILVTGKLIYIQVFQHQYYRTLAAEEHWQAITLPAERGDILAADGRPLSESVTYESLYIDAKHVKDLDKTLAKLAPVIGQSEVEMRTKIAAAGDHPTLLQQYMPMDAANKVRALRLYNVYFEPEAKRLNPEGALASQLLGFVGKDQQGLLGLEMSWDKQLAGQPGRLYSEVDTAGSAIALGPSDLTVARDGADVVTTIDRFIQRTVERILQDAVTRHSADSGTIIVMNPHTGAILGAASRPSFSLTDPTMFEQSARELRFPAVSDVFEPGSIFKVITMAAGLDAGAVRSDEIYYDAGYVTESGINIYNWDGNGHGWQTMAEVIQRSLNTGSSYVARKLGAERFYDYVTAFGFGTLTNVDLPGEGEGIVRRESAQGWSPTDLLTNSFGQGIGVTSIQMARAVGAIANGGKLMKPQIVSEIRDANGVHKVAPVVERQVIRPETAAAMNRIMVNAVEESVVGTAKVPGYKVAGKSGTAEMLVDGVYSKQDTIASYVGFAPAEAPQFVVLVSIVRPRDNIWGEAVAAPIFSDLLRELMLHSRIAPSQVAQR